MKHIKTFESFSTDLDNVNNVEKVDEGVLADFGHFLGLDSATRKKIKSDLAKIDLKDEVAVDRLLYTVFPKEQIKGAVKPYINKASLDNKVDILQQASQDKDGIGVLAFKDGALAYKPAKQVKWAGPEADSMNRPRN